MIARQSLLACGRLIGNVSCPGCGLRLRSDCDRLKLRRGRELEQTREQETRSGLGFVGSPARVRVLGFYRFGFLA
ncbi:hypothetical protein F2Q69_00058490 [Brassica cretica]|uniref:Uncharacterized protein n=1 Tax=Brassica cretica TaxID=69181 RepID=A0A8S9RQ03_BRACR|nr:hypothetical protein F2Q69_00058490 [Brassica cretica]